MPEGPPRDPRASVSDQLLGPFIEAAADTLRGLEPENVPATLRHLHGFDRRGLMRGPGPRQLRRAFDDDEGFRERVRERLAALTAVGAVLTQWSTADAWQLVEDAARRHDLPVLASTLWACAPAGADFGLGLVVALDTFERRARADADAFRARERKFAELEEARRRADAARVVAEAAAARAEEDLRAERGARRSREEHAEAEAHAARGRADEVAAQLEHVQAAAEGERTRAEREARRARELEGDVRQLRAELVASRAKSQQAPSRLDARDARSLADVAGEAQRLGAQLEVLRRRIAASAPSPAAGTPEPGRLPEKPLARRITPPLPPGIVATSKAGVEAMLQCPDVVLVIDGYNVTKRAWPDASASEQRERLGVGVTQFERRFGCRVLCVFDGDGSDPHVAIRRGGVRVVFSDAGEEADEVVVREVAALPKRVPVVVASSDGWIREHAEREGAIVIPADALLAIV